MNNESSLNDARLDRAIDRAVREMMQVDPTSGFRRRVLSRLHAPAKQRTFPVLRYGFAAAGLAVIVLSISLLPGHVEPPTPPKPPVAVAPLEGRVPPIAEGLPTRAKPLGVTKEPIPMPQVTNVFGDRRSGVSAATVREPGAIRIAPETLAALAIVPLSSRPIVIEPLVLPALPK